MKAKMDEQMTEKKWKTTKHVFWRERKIEQRKWSKWKMQEKTYKKSRMKKRRKEKGRNRIKKADTHNIFKTNEIFFKNQKMWKKRRYRNWTQKRCEEQFKILKKKKLHKIQNLEKGNHQRNRKKKNKETFQNEGFFDVSRRLEKAQNWRWERGQKNQKRENKKHFQPEGRKTEQEKHVFKNGKTREKRKTQRE